MTKITWHGHACFEISSDKGSIVFDPYEEDYIPGIKMPRLTADMVISSHRHHDHYAPDAVSLTGNELAAVITRIPCFHDEVNGKKRGENLISIVELDGIRICHMGDIGHMLIRGQLDTFGKVDILMIPVGGVYTVDAAAAKELCSAIKPGTVVPMHFKGRGKGLQNIAPVDEFIELFAKEDIWFLDSCSICCEELLKHPVVVFPWP